MSLDPRLREGDNGADDQEKSREIIRNGYMIFLTKPKFKEQRKFFRLKDGITGSLGYRVIIICRASYPLP